MAQSPCFLLPLLIPFCPLSLFPLLTWNPPSCDRIRPPRSQVTRKLTSPFSTVSHSLPTPNSQYPVNKRLTMKTSRIRLLLSGTVYSVLRLIAVQNILCWLACSVHNGPPSLKYQYSLSISSLGLSSLCLYPSICTYTGT
jgi:hypothetical protein